MISIDDIRTIHLEISTRCNSVCPGCPRNFFGVESVEDYPVCDMRLDQAKAIFTPDFISQLDYFLINGNYGDFVTARDGLAIVKYLRSANADMQIRISTNGSAQPGIWTELAKYRPVVEFRLDGLQDTHSLYRQKTDWQLIIDNARKFIDAGGHAIWAMIVFDHNRHQIDSCREMSQELGFREFTEVYADRDNMPVFDSTKKLTHVIGNYQGPKEFDVLWKWQNNYQARWDRSFRWYRKDVKKISCPAKRGLNIYVAANGEVYPCCWTGFYPRTSDLNPGNHQLRAIVKDNNALEHGLEKALAWFESVEQSWSKSDVDSGRLFICHQTCGESHD